MNSLEQLGTFVARGVEQVRSDAVWRTAGLHVIDTVGAWIAGACTPEGRALIAYHDGLPQHIGSQANLLDEIALHCALARLSEIDDIHLASITTPGAIVVPSALTLATALKSEPHVVGEAIIAGYEVMVRLGLVLNGPTILYRGIWPTYLTAPAGVAAVCSRLLGLSAQQAAHALALALTASAPGVGHHNAATTSRWMAVGNAARAGAWAGFAARAGFTADLSLLDGSFFPSVYQTTPDLAALVAGLGETSVVPELSFKPWCAARQTMVATQALKELMGAGLALDDVVSVTAFVPPPQLKMVAHGVAIGDRASFLTSLPYHLAIAALTPEAEFDVAQSPSELSGVLRSFMDKVKVEPDDKLLAQYPKVWPARVVVQTRSTSHERVLTQIPGDPGLAFDAKDVRAKFDRVASRSIGDAATADLLKRCLAAVDTGSYTALLQAIIAVGSVRPMMRR